MWSKLTYGLAALLFVAAAGNPTRAGALATDSALETLGLTRYWNAHLPLTPHDAVKEAYRLDDALYVITDQGTLFALSAEMGLIRWARKVTNVDFLVYKPTHMRTADGHGPLVVLTTGDLLVLDRYSGDLLHRAKPDFTLGSAPVAWDNVLFLGSSDGQFYSVVPRGDAEGGLMRRWHVTAGSAVTAAPLLHGAGKLLFATHGGVVVSCGAADKTLDWSFRTGGAILGDPAVNDTGLYIASTDRSLYKLDGHGGVLVWRRRFPCELHDGPVVTEDTAYQFCESRGLSAIDTDSGEELWSLVGGRAFVAQMDDGDAIVWTTDRKLVRIQREGNARGAISVPGVASVVANALDEAVYLLGRDGRVLCATHAGKPYLREGVVKAAKIGLNSPPSSSRPSPEGKTDQPGSESTGWLDDPLRSERDVRPER